MTQPWLSREYREGDERGILELYKLVFGKELSAEHWQWKYKKNSAGQALIILAESDEGIVGQYALLPRLVKVGDDVQIGSLSVDTIVHTGYRGQGMFITLAEEAYRLATRRGIHFVYGFPNQNSHYAFVSRLGWVDLYKGIPLWVKPLNLANLLHKRLVNNKLLASLGGKIGDIVIRVLYKSSVPTPLYSVRETYSFDSRFDYLCSEASREHKIMVIRDRAYLTWRYLEKPDNDYVILIAEEGENLLGYAVLSSANEFGLQIGFIVDVLTVPRETQAAMNLISAAIRYFTLRRVDMVGCLMLPGTHYSHSLRHAGFIKTPNKLLPQKMYLGIRRFDTQYPTTLLADANNWLISWGDHDTI